MTNESYIFEKIKQVSMAKIGLVIAGLILLLLLLMHLTKNSSKKTAPKQTRHIILGAWTKGLIDPATQKIHPEKLLAFQRLVHKKVSIAHYYIGWEALADPKLINQFATIRKYDWEPMVNVNPYYFSECPATNLPLYRAISDGRCDDFLRKAGKNLKHVKQPFYLLFAWEMNNPQNEWSIEHTGSTSQDFVTAWQHIHTIFAEEGASNIIWVFCPNIPNDPQAPYAKIYPGDAYVDWVGLDGYNWGTTQPWSQWTNFSGVFGGSYKTLSTIAPKKPMLIAEVNTTNEGGDKGAWYEDMFTEQLPYHFPRIKMVVIFNEDKSKNEHVNWNVDISPNALKSFISGVHTKFYR